MDKSHSESDICQKEPSTSTPPNFVATRNKRRREEDTDITQELNDFKEDMKAMITTLLVKQEQEIAKISPTLKEIQQSNTNIEGSISFLSAQNDELKKKIESLETQVKHDREYITLLEEKIEDIHLGSRKANLEIKSVPKKPNETREDLIDMVECLSKTVGGELRKSGINDIYRVRSKKEGIINTPIIVETSSTLLKIDMLKKCKTFNTNQKTKLCAEHLGLRTFVDTPIFISEQLTAKGSRLHFLARDLVKTKKFKFCWTAYGKVYVRKEENAPVIAIRCEAQIHQLINQA